MNVPSSRRSGDPSPPALSPVELPRKGDLMTDSIDGRAQHGNQEAQRPHGRFRQWFYRLLWIVLFLPSATAAWWVTYHHHAAAATILPIIIVLISLSALSLYKSSAGNAQIVSAAAAVVVLAMALAQLQKSPPSHSGQILVEKWAACPRDRNPTAGRAPKDPEPSPGFPVSYGRAHIDSVIAPNGSAEVRAQELVCISMTAIPSPNRILWLVSRIEPTPVPPQKPYKLFFAIAQIGNPKLGTYSVRYMRGCSSSPAGSVHTLMTVSADPLQNRKLWKDYDANHTGNCDTGNRYDQYRHRLIGAIVSNQLDVIHE